jgi:SAM-dependent methyltransferase
MPGTTNRPYKLLAEYYDRFFTFHLPWFEAARERVLGSFLPRVESACDLACGTGTTALLLAGRGIKMFAVDLSPVMCRLAWQKARRIGLPLRVLRADMRAFRLPEPVDLVLCEFDALNHVPSKADLALVASAVAEALRPGGHFYFDVNNRLALETIWPGAWWIEEPDVAMVMHGGYDHRQDRGWTNIEWFLREGRCWRRCHERVEQVCWTSTEIRGALRRAGFDQIRAWDATPFFEDDPKIRPGCRTFYLARKSPVHPV